MTKDALVTHPLDGIDTVCDVLEYAARTHGTKDSYGWRDVIDIIEEKKEVKKVEVKKEEEHKTEACEACGKKEGTAPSFS